MEKLSIIVSGASLTGKIKNLVPNDVAVRICEEESHNKSIALIGNPGNYSLQKSQSGIDIIGIMDELDKLYKKSSEIFAKPILPIIDMRSGITDYIGNIEQEIGEIGNSDILRDPCIKPSQQIYNDKFHNRKPYDQRSHIRR